MILLGREQEAIGLAELLTDAERKARVLTTIGVELAKLDGQEQDRLSVLLRAGEVAYTIEDNTRRVNVLRDLAVALAQIGAVEKAQALTREIMGAREGAEALEAIAAALVQAGQAEKALTLAQALQSPEARAWALQAVVEALLEAGNLKDARWR
jgi:hypothetical protein